MDLNPQALLESSMQLMTTWGARVLGVLFALTVGTMVASWARRSVLRTLESRRFDLTLTRFFANLARYAILVGVGLGCLGVFGIETTSFAAIIGAAGLAIGLAFQGTLANFSSGIMLLVFRPFKVGDFVSAGGVSGVIEEIELFTTHFRTVDNRKVVVPNGAIFGSTIENVTFYEKRRVDIDVGCDYGADVDRCREVLEGMAPGIEGSLSDPPPQIFLKGLGGSSVDWQVRIWCKTDDYWDVYQATIRGTKRALDEAGIGIPFPQMDVHIDKAAE